jgi:hypothetical protein
MNKIEEIRKALEGASEGPWHISTDHWGNVDVVSFSGLVVAEGQARDAPLIALAHDMAQIVLAAEKLADAVNVMHLMPHGVTNEVFEAYTNYRKAVENPND